MEFTIFIPLMVAAIQSSGQVLASFVSKAKAAASNYILDKEFVENTVIDSSEQLAELLNARSVDIRREIQEQSIVEAVQELQAHIKSIGKILSFVETSEITPAMAERLITGGLLPLQIALEKTELRLTHYGKDDLRLYCHVIGTNTLIAGYAYAGQSVPTLHTDLKDSIYSFQKRLLDAISQSHQVSNLDMPWDKVPFLLTADGISELYELYNSTLAVSKKKSQTDSKVQKIEKPKREVKQKSKDDEEFIGYALKINSFFGNTIYCSECGYDGLKKSTLICPRCKRSFSKSHLG